MVSGSPTTNVADCGEVSIFSYSTSLFRGTVKLKALDHEKLGVLTFDVCRLISRPVFCTVAG